jgi:SnoaL-like domain
VTDAGSRRGVQAFRSAVEAGDADALLATLAPEVRFSSPAVFRPYEGRAAVAPLLRAVTTVLSPTIHYTWEVRDPERAVLGFIAQAGDKELEGVDIVTWGDDGLIQTLTVMIRPLSGLVTLRDAIADQLTADSSPG